VQVVPPVPGSVPQVSGGSRNNAGPGCATATHCPALRFVEGKKTPSVTVFRRGAGCRGARPRDAGVRPRCGRRRRHICGAGAATGGRVGADRMGAWMKAGWLSWVLGGSSSSSG
jgi:hypothetical protein